MVVQSLRLVVALSAQISTYELVVLKCHRSQRIFAYLSVRVCKNEGYNEN